METYGKTKEEVLERLNSYKNPDPRCTYPFSPKPLGYCWAYANHVDGTRGFEDMEAICKDCNMWRGEFLERQVKNGT